MPPAETHATLGASSSHRWMNCPGSIRMSAGIPRETSEYAEEGSAAHYLAEYCLRQNKEAEEHVGNYLVKKGDSYGIYIGPDDENCFEVTEEMAEAVQVYLDCIREDQKSNPGTTLSIEKRFNLNELHPGMFGTNDACLEEPFGKVIVYDYKHGRGVAVEVEANPQLLYYALGAYYGSDFEEVELVIVQPRARHKKGPVRRWTVPVQYLRNWAEKSLLPKAKATEEPNAPVVAGEWCKFCPAMAICPALNAMALEVAKTDLDSIPLPAPDQLSMVELVKVLNSAELLKSWLNSVSAHAFGILEKGCEVPGWKLVQKRANRKWDESTEIKKWPDEFYTEPKLVSPAQAEKIIKQMKIKTDLLSHVVHPEGGLTLAPESDRREAVCAKPVVDMFDTITIEDF